MTFSKITKLLSALDAVKHLKRTGWVKMNVPEPETVASHMYRMAVLAMSLGDQVEGLDVVRVVYMCLVHDLAEAIVGDITPHCGVSDEDKYERENEAAIFAQCGRFDDLKASPHESEVVQISGGVFVYRMGDYGEAIQQIASFVPVATAGNLWVELWREYEAQQTLEAKVVKHLDKFDMIAQAFDYERKYGLDLSQFFESTKTAFSIAPFVLWNNELRIQRDEWRSNHSINDQE